MLLLIVTRDGAPSIDLGVLRMPNDHVTGSHHVCPTLEAKWKCDEEIEVSCGRAGHWVTDKANLQASLCGLTRPVLEATTYHYTIYSWYLTTPGSKTKIILSRHTKDRKTY